MNVLRPLTDGLRQFFRNFLAYGLQATVKEESAQFGAEVIRAQGRLGAAAAEALDAAEALEGKGGEHRQEITRLLSEGIVETVRVYKAVSSFKMTPSQGAEALADDFFSPGSEPIAHSSLDSEKPKAIVHHSPNGKAPTKRGRPEGSKNRPKQPAQDA